MSNPELQFSNIIQSRDPRINNEASIAQKINEAKGNTSLLEKYLKLLARAEPLHESSYLPGIKLILKITKDLDIEYIEVNGESFVEAALDSEDSELEDLVINYPGLDEGYRLILLIGNRGNPETIKRLIDNPDPKIDLVGTHYYEKALMEAARIGDEATVKLLLSKPNIDVNYLHEFHQETPLALAIYFGTSPLRNNTNVIKLLLKHPKIDIYKKGVAPPGSSKIIRSAIERAEESNNPEVRKIYEQYLKGRNVAEVATMSRNEVTASTSQTNVGQSTPVYRPAPYLDPNIQSKIKSFLGGKSRKHCKGKKHTRKHKRHSRK